MKEWESIAIFKNAADCYVSQQFHRVAMGTQNFCIFLLLTANFMFNYGSQFLVVYVFHFNLCLTELEIIYS